MPSPYHHYISIALTVTNYFVIKGVTSQPGHHVSCLRAITHIGYSRDVYALLYLAYEQALEQLQLICFLFLFRHYHTFKVGKANT